MLFTTTLTVPADTAELAPATAELRLVKGTIRHYWISYKSGCAWMVYVAVRHNLQQIIPASPDEALNFDEYVFEGPISYPLEAQANWLSVEGWSPGTLYPHTIRVALEVEPAGEMSWQDAFASLFFGSPESEGAA